MPARKSSSTKWYKLNARNAKIEQGPKDNRVEYDEFVGTLIGLEYKKEESEEYGVTRRYLFKFDDGEGNTEILSSSVGTIATCNILNCLDNIEGDIGYLLIRPYVLDNLNVAAIYMEHEGSQVDWAHKPGEYPDGDNERTRFFHDIFESLQEKLENQDNDITENLYGDNSDEDKEPLPAREDNVNMAEEFEEDSLPF